MDENVRIVLPEHYDLVVGDTFQLFYRGIIEAANPYCYDILSVCEQGHNFPRYFELTPTEPGCVKLTVCVYGNNKNLLAYGDTNLIIHSASHEPKRNINILCVGDSLTAGGIWVKEASRRLTQNGGTPAGNGFSNICFIGTRGQDNIKWEGYGGWQWSNYLQADKSCLSSVWVESKNSKTEADQHSLWKDSKGELWQLETIEDARLKFTRYNNHGGELPEVGTLIEHYSNADDTSAVIVNGAYPEGLNPFADFESERVDFVNYCNKNSFDGIDVVYFFLTWNGLFGEKDPIMCCKKMVRDGKRLVQILHEQYPHAEIKIMGLPFPSVNGGTGANYGAVLPYCDDYGLILYVMELNRQYEKWAFEEEYLEFINVSGQFDSENNMPSTQKPVNTRSTRTEVIGTNGVHPAEEGYLQIADAVYRNIIKTICKINEV